MIMKLVFVSLLFATVNARELATTFTIDGGDPPTTWQPLIDNTNSVTITFGLNGESSTAFNTAATDCSNAGEFLMIAPSPTTAADASSVTVTFQNKQHMDETPVTACVDMSLFVDGITAAVATRRFTYSVTAPQSGTDSNVQATYGSIGGVAANAMVEDAATQSAAHEMTFTPTIITTGAIKFGEAFRVEVPAAVGFGIDVTGVTPGIIEAEPNGIDYVAYPTNKAVTIQLPLTSFLDGKTTESFTMTVAWQVDQGAYVRSLRGLAEDSQHGTIDYEMSVELVPYEGSYAYTVKPVTFCASAGMAGVAAMLI